jgi:F-type H+-transporting ATPase subunit b
MPQLDPAGFAPQIFWLLVCFVVLYLLMWRIALPKVADVLRARQERIDDDLEKAGRLKEEAEAALAAYEASIAKGRADAQAVLREAAERMAKEAATRQAETVARLDRETQDAERRIAEARREALANVRAVAAEAARAATAKLIGADVAAPEADEAARRALGDRGGA